MPRTSAIGALASLLDNSSRPIYVVDDRRRVIYCNAALAAWLDLDRERIIGRTVEYHSELAAQAATLHDDTPLVDLSPPPSALAGTPCRGTISSVGRDGGLAHRRADFVPLGALCKNSKSDKTSRLQEGTREGVLVVLATENFSPQDIASNLSGELSPDELHRAIRQFRRDHASKYALISLLGDSTAIRKVRAQVAAAAASGANILICGPAGSGRGHVARAIHYGAGGDLAPKLIAIQCEIAGDELLRGALDNLRGSVGGSRHRPTLLLEHLECLADSHQSQLVAAIRQNFIPGRIIATCCSHQAYANRFRPVPGRRAVAESGRFSARSQAPEDDSAEAAAPTINIELVNAISTITIDVPSLIDRLEDLPILAQSFLESCNVGSAKQVGSIRPEALDLLALHSWPGELHELREVIAAAHEAATSQEITAANLPAVIHHASHAAARIRRRPERIVLDEFLAAIEKEAIVRAMSHARGNKSEAAELLGMTRSRLYRRLVQLGLVSEAQPESELEQPEFVEHDPPDHAT